MQFKMYPEMETLFSAVSVQLENVGIQSGRRNLRAELVEYLQSSPYTHGSSHLRDYVSAPVIADYPLNRQILRHQPGKTRSLVLLRMLT